MSKEKNIDEDIIEMLVQRISKTNMPEEEKKLYTKKILKYMKLKIDYYKIMGIDISLGTLFIGMGVGTSVTQNDSPYLPFVFYGLGAASILTTSMKRKIKYKNTMDSFIKKEIDFWRRKW